MKKIIIAVLLLTGMIVQAQEMTTLSKSAYSIKYPSTWKVANDANAKQFTIKSPTASNEDLFVENLNLAVETLPTIGYTAQQYASFSKGYLPQKIKKFIVLKNEKGNLGKESWYMEFKGLQNGTSLQWKQYYIVQNGRVHILTFTAEPGEYKKFLPVVNSMLASYRIK